MYSSDTSSEGRDNMSEHSIDRSSKLRSSPSLTRLQNKNEFLKLSDNKENFSENSDDPAFSSGEEIAVNRHCRRPLVVSSSWSQSEDKKHESTKHKLCTKQRREPMGSEKDDTTTVQAFKYKSYKQLSTSSAPNTDDSKLSSSSKSSFDSDDIGLIRPPLIGQSSDAATTSVYKPSTSVYKPLTSVYKPSTSGYKQAPTSVYKQLPSFLSSHISDYPDALSCKVERLIGQKVSLPKTDSVNSATFQKLLLEKYSSARPVSLSEVSQNLNKTDTGHLDQDDSHSGSSPPTIGQANMKSQDEDVNIPLMSFSDEMLDLSNSNGTSRSSKSLLSEKSVQKLRKTLLEGSTDTRVQSSLSIDNRAVVGTDLPETNVTMDVLTQDPGSIGLRGNISGESCPNLDLTQSSSRNQNFEAPSFSSSNSEISASSLTTTVHSSAQGNVSRNYVNSSVQSVNKDLWPEEVDPCTMAKDMSTYQSYGHNQELEEDNNDKVDSRSSKNLKFFVVDADIMDDLDHEKPSANTNRYLYLRPIDSDILFNSTNKMAEPVLTSSHQHNSASQSFVSHNHEHSSQIGGPYHKEGNYYMAEGSTGYSYSNEPSVVILDPCFNQPAELDGDNFTQHPGKLIYLEDSNLEQLIASQEEIPHLRWYPYDGNDNPQDIKDAATQTAMSYLAEQLLEANNWIQVPSPEVHLQLSQEEDCNFQLVPQPSRDQESGESTTGKEMENGSNRPISQTGITPLVETGFNLSKTKQKNRSSSSSSSGCSNTSDSYLSQYSKKPIRHVSSNVRNAIDLGNLVFDGSITYQQVSHNQTNVKLPVGYQHLFDVESNGLIDRNSVSEPKIDRTRKIKPLVQYDTSTSSIAKDSPQFRTLSFQSKEDQLDVFNTEQKFPLNSADKTLEVSKSEDGMSIPLTLNTKAAPKSSKFNEKADKTQDSKCTCSCCLKNAQMLTEHCAGREKLKVDVLEVSKESFASSTIQDSMESSYQSSREDTSQVKRTTDPKTELSKQRKNHKQNQSVEKFQVISRESSNKWTIRSHGNYYIAEKIGNCSGIPLFTFLPCSPSDSLNSYADSEYSQVSTKRAHHSLLGISQSSSDSEIFTTGHEKVRQIDKDRQLLKRESRPKSSYMRKDAQVITQRQHEEKQREKTDKSSHALGKSRSAGNVPQTSYLECLDEILNRQRDDFKKNLLYKNENTELLDDIKGIHTTISNDINEAFKLFSIGNANSKPPSENLIDFTTPSSPEDAKNSRPDCLKPENVQKPGHKNLNFSPKIQTKTIPKRTTLSRTPLELNLVPKTMSTQTSASMLDANFYRRRAISMSAVHDLNADKINRVNRNNGVLKKILVKDSAKNLKPSSIAWVIPITTKRTKSKSPNRKEPMSLQDAFKQNCKRVAKNVEKRRNLVVELMEIRKSLLLYNLNERAPEFNHFLKPEEQKKTKTTGNSGILKSSNFSTKTYRNIQRRNIEVGLKQLHRMSARKSPFKIIRKPSLKTNFTTYRIQGKIFSKNLKEGVLKGRVNWKNTETVTIR